MSTIVDISTFKYLFVHILNIKNQVKAALELSITYHGKNGCLMVTTPMSAVCRFLVISPTNTIIKL